MSVATAVRLGTAAEVPRDATRRSWPWSRVALIAICAVQVALAVRPGSTRTPFEDEGLYVYIGHRMIDHLLHGTLLTEYPGAYFSGAPGFYPVLAALGDWLGGIQGARAVSLLFTLGATVSINGLGRELYNRGAGLLGAGAFVLCGSVIYQSHLATYDSATLCFVAAAAWLTAYSVTHDQFVWAPAVATLLVAAFYAKYAGAVYIPVVAGLAVTVAPKLDRLIVARGVVVMILSVVVLAYFIFALWGESLREGIIITTTSRTVLQPAHPSLLIHQVIRWVGPWLALAALGAFVGGRRWALTGVLLLGSIVGPLGQIRIGEATSLAKHSAFGMIFACPLVGALLAWLVHRLRVVTIPTVASVFAVLATSGLTYSHQFLTGWPDDTALLPVLTRLIAASPGKPILGEEPAAEHYALRTTTHPLQWKDTFSFSYGHQTGLPAYKEAIGQTSFAVIYLQRTFYAGQHTGKHAFSPSTYGSDIYEYLTTAPTPYRLVRTVNVIEQGKVTGDWYIFTPKAVPTNPGAQPDPKRPTPSPPPIRTTPGPLTPRAVTAPRKPKTPLLLPQHPLLVTTAEPTRTRG